MTVELNKADKTAPRQETKTENKRQMAPNGKSATDRHGQSHPDITPMKRRLSHARPSLALSLIDGEYCVP